MFIGIKKQARAILKQNYKVLVIPCLAFMLSQFLISLILNVFTSKLTWSDHSEALMLAIILLYAVLRFIAVPFSTASIFRITNSISKNAGSVVADYKDFFNMPNILKLAAITFVPNAFLCFSEINRSKITALRIARIEGIPLIIISVISIFLSYKFYACEYCFAVNNSSVKQTIAESFRLMNGVFFKIILLLLSFIPWIALSAAIYLAAKIIAVGGVPFDMSRILSFYTPYIDSLLSINFGLGLYLEPYIYVSMFIFFAGIEKTKKK